MIQILKGSLRGQAALKFYSLNHSLTDDIRDDIINCIVEEIIFNDVSVTIAEFHLIVQEIVELFPCEDKIKDYYFIPRCEKKNPSGKLFVKYVNTKSRKKNKRQKADSIIEPKNKNISISSIDETEQLSIKNDLKRSLPWDEVCEKWKNTVQLRRRDFELLNNTEFFEAWPKYLDARAPELVILTKKIFIKILNIVC